MLACHTIYYSADRHSTGLTTCWKQEVTLCLCVCVFLFHFLPFLQIFISFCVFFILSSMFLFPFPSFLSLLQMWPFLVFVLLYLFRLTHHSIHLLRKKKRGESEAIKELKFLARVLLVSTAKMSVCAPLLLIKMAFWWPQTSSTLPNTLTTRAHPHTHTHTHTVIAKKVSLAFLNLHNLNISCCPAAVL